MVKPGLQNYRCRMREDHQQPLWTQEGWKLNRCTKLNWNGGQRGNIQHDVAMLYGSLIKPHIHAFVFSHHKITESMDLIILATRKECYDTN